MIYRDFTLGNKFTPERHKKIFRDDIETRDKVAFPVANGALSSVAAMCAGWHTLRLDFRLAKKFL
jgi:hypothetical protein